jgi:3-keto-5-aminohexanoate cleavage enzyme
MQNKIIIVVAPNGGMQKDRDGARVPITPEEIAAEALACRNAGAAVVHFHARDANGANSSDPALYSDVISRIRSRTDVLVQTTNGIGVRRSPASGELIWPSDSERLALLTVKPRPDLYGIASGSMDFYHPEGGYPGETTYVNSIDFLRATLPHVYAVGSTVEFELTDVNVVHRLSRLADEGIIDRAATNLWMLHGFGIGCTPPTARAFAYSRDEQKSLFPNALWGVLGAGHAQFRIAAMGMAMGCDTIRVGFEDNLYLPNGGVARHNAELVEAAVSLARAIGREPATPQEARESFGLDH